MRVPLLLHTQPLTPISLRAQTWYPFQFRSWHNMPCSRHFLCRVPNSRVFMSRANCSLFSSLFSLPSSEVSTLQRWTVVGMWSKTERNERGLQCVSVAFQKQRRALIQLGARSSCGWRGKVNLTRRARFISHEDKRLSAVFVLMRARARRFALL